MAPIFRELIIEWQGKEYTCTPTMRDVQEFEQNDTVLKLAQDMSNDLPPLSRCSALVAILLRRGGCKSVTDLDVMAEFTTSGITPEGWLAIATECLTSCFPIIPEKERAKAENPLPATAGKGKKKGQKKGPEN